jgi:hypothetical protein
MPIDIVVLKKDLKFQKEHLTANQLAIEDTRKRIQALEKVIERNVFKDKQAKRIAERALAGQRSIIKILHIDTTVFSNRIQQLKKEIKGI